MILVIDEIANLSSDHTLLVSGQPMNYLHFPDMIKRQGLKGVISALQSTCPPWGGWHMVTPVTADSSTVPPSTAAASLLDAPPLTETPGIWPPPTYASGWQAEDWGFATWPVSLLPGPQNPEPHSRPLPPPMMHNTGSPSILVVKSDGSAVLSLIELISYLSSGAQGQLKVGDNTCISGLGLVSGDNQPGREPPLLGHVLRISTWLLTAAQVGHAAAFGAGVQPGPGSWQTPIPPSWGWPQPKGRTLMIADQSTMRDWDGRQFVPSSPILHLRIGVGDTLLLRFGRSYNCQDDEIAYDESVRLKKLKAQQAMAQGLMAFYKLIFDAFTDNWEDITAEEEFSEILPH